MTPDPVFQHIGDPVQHVENIIQQFPKVEMLTPDSAVVIPKATMRTYAFDTDRSTEAIQ